MVCKLHVQISDRCEKNRFHCSVFKGDSGLLIQSGRFQLMNVDFLNKEGGGVKRGLMNKERRWKGNIYY